MWRGFVLVQQVCKLRSRAHGELAVYAGQIGLHGLGRDEELRSGLLVGVACSDELSDPAFCLGELVRAGVQAHPSGFVASSFGPARDAQRLECGSLRRSAPAGHALVSRAAVDLPEGQPGSGRLERALRSLQVDDPDEVVQRFVHITS